MEFPKMIYLGGEHGAAHRIVADQAAQDAAKADGFLPFGGRAKAAVNSAETAADGQPDGPAPHAVDGKADLIAALESAGIPHKKSWGVSKLRAALDANPA